MGDQNTTSIKLLKAQVEMWLRVRAKWACGLNPRTCRFTHPLMGGAGPRQASSHGETYIREDQKETCCLLDRLSPKKKAGQGLN